PNPRSETPQHRHRSPCGATDALQRLRAIPCSLHERETSARIYPGVRQRPLVVRWSSDFSLTDDGTGSIIDLSKILLGSAVLTVINLQFDKSRSILVSQ